MASKITLTPYTFEGELIQGMNELLFDEVLKSPDIAAFLKIYPDIKVVKEVGFIGGGTRIGKANTGCNSNPQD
jgi:hypothetical protein